MLSDGSEIPFGLMVWSTGIKQVSLIENMSAEQVGKFKHGRLKIDPWLHVCAAVPLIKVPVFLLAMAVFLPWEIALQMPTSPSLPSRKSLLNKHSMSPRHSIVRALML